MNCYVPSHHIIHHNTPKPIQNYELFSIIRSIPSPAYAGAAVQSSVIGTITPSPLPFRSASASHPQMRAEMLHAPGNPKPNHCVHPSQSKARLPPSRPDGDPMHKRRFVSWRSVVLSTVKCMPSVPCRAECALKAETRMPIPEKGKVGMGTVPNKNMQEIGK
jgi:hypothetical protein